MPPKESKELKIEINEIIDQVRGFWPDFYIDSELLTNPTAEFVTCFYTNVITEMIEKYSYLLDEETASHETVDNKDFDIGVQFFCAIADIFRVIKVNTFCLNDIYRPVPKRTRFFIRSVMHFLVYIEANMQGCSSLADNIFKKVDERNRLQVEKQDLLQEISLKAENISKMVHEREKLLEAKISVTEECRKLSNIKHIKEKIYADKQSQLDKLAGECENEEYQLKCLEKEEANLKEQVISDEDYQGLKDMEKMLETELERLSLEDVALDDALKAQKENLHSLQCCINSLMSVTMDALAKTVVISQELEDQNKKNECENSILSEEIKHLQCVRDKTITEINSLSEILIQKESEYKQRREEIAETLENLKKEHEVCKNAVIFKMKKSDEMLKKIKLQSEKISEIKANMEYFKAEFAVEYKKVLDNERQVIHATLTIFSQIKANGDDILQ